MQIPSITPTEIIQKYDAILLDAFGVLVYQYQPMPGAVQFIQHLNAIGKPYFILTNDAAHSLPSSVARFAKLGFSMREEQIITSGSLLKSYFQDHDLQGHGCVVLGTNDSRGYVVEAGGKIIPIEQDQDWDVLVACDEMGYPFLETVDAAISGLFHKLDRGESVHLLVTNPDLIYRKNELMFGITSGSIALIIEAALKLRYAENTSLGFIRLGKPYAPIFQEAYRRSGTKRMVMIGDQIPYDIRGAKNFGIDAVLMGTGVTNLEKLELGSPDLPNFILNTWA